MSITVMEQPSVWIGCLSCYNSGRLTGEWFPAIVADEVTLEDIHAHARGPFPDCEEVWCMDVDNMPVHEEMSVVEAAEWGRLLEAAEDQDIFRAWVKANDKRNPSEIVLHEVSDSYQGQWNSLKDMTDDMFWECHEVPEHLTPYVDLDAWYRDVRHEYTAIEAPDGGVYVFRDE